MKNERLFLTIFCFFSGTLLLLSGFEAKLTGRQLFMRSLGEGVYPISSFENILLGILFIIYALYLCFFIKK